MTFRLMTTLLLLTSTQAFIVVTPSSAPSSALHGFMDAFKNDDSLGAAPSAGLKNGPNYNTAVTVNGKAVTGAVVGQPLTAVAAKARVKIPVNCQQGDCGTCTIKLNGRKVKACQMKLPSGKVTMDTRV